ncbi:hypothetical protein [Asanoa ishikariensis]|nr:hypothetical protein [Asanoa ishikariensis]
MSIVSATLLGLAASFFVAQAPASAAIAECTLTPADNTCTTGTLSANPTYHAIRMFAWGGSGDIDCWVYDVDSRATVGSIHAGWGNQTALITGLYGRYTMGCAQVGGTFGDSSGGINNADSATSPGS